MSETTTRNAALATTRELGDRGIAIRTIDDLKAMAGAVVASGLAPAGIQNAAQAFIAIQTGLEVGFTPMQALRSLAVIKGRPSWMGKAALALCRQRGVLTESPTVRYEGPIHADKKGLDRYDDSFACVVTMQRVGEQRAHSFTYSVEDAKQARLWGKTSRSGEPTPWVTSPKIMLYWRALGHGLDQLFSDVLLGLPLREVAQDFEPEAGFEHAREVKGERLDEAETPEGPPDPLLAYFNKAIPAGEEGEVPVEAILGPQNANTERGPAEAPATPSAVEMGEGPLPEDPVEELELPEDQVDAEGDSCAEGLHTWTFGGDPMLDQEPTTVCSKCGLVLEDDGQLELA